MNCPWCGNDNTPGADLCEMCRHSLIDVEPAPPRSELHESVEIETLSILEPAEPVIVAPTATVAEVVRLLAERNIGCVLVVSDEALVGIFSERDVLMKIGTRFDVLANAPIRDFMTPRPQTLSADDTIAFAMNRMADGGFRHVPIEADGKPVGIISVRDVLAYLVRQFPDCAPGTA